MEPNRDVIHYRGVVAAEEEGRVDVNGRDDVGWECARGKLRSKPRTRNEPIQKGNAALLWEGNCTAIDVALRGLVATVDGNLHAISIGQCNLDIISHTGARQ